MTTIKTLSVNIEISDIVNPFQDQVTSCVSPKEADGCACDLKFDGTSYEIADLASARAFKCLQEDSGISLNFRLISK